MSKSMNNKEGMLAKFKYHGHTLVKRRKDLGASEERLNCVYEIYGPDGNYIETALACDGAKDYIDSGYNETYLHLFKTIKPKEKNMKDIGMARVKAEKKLREICGDIITLSKRGRIWYVKDYYHQLLGACAIYLHFIETDAKNYVVYAQDFLENVCEERGEDYEHIMHYAVGW